MTDPGISSIGFSINDFPTEIIEMFAPDISTKTLIILRSVNKRFYSVFSQDRFWTCHLLYSEKQYLCDLRSNSNIASVKDVLMDISQSRISKNHGYFRLQNIHLENWLCGPTQNCYAIDSLPSTVSFMEDIIDDNYERWLFLSVNVNIHIWNITATPYPLKCINVGPHSKLKVLPGVKVITFNKNNGLVSVYKFEGKNVTLKCKFTYYMDSSIDSPQQVPHKDSCKFIVIGNYFIGYNHKISSYQGKLLHVWDLASCIKKASLSLSQLDYSNEFQNLVHGYSRTNIRDIRVNCKGCKIDLYPGIHPNMVVSLRYPSDRLSVVLIFNMELFRVTHFIDTFTSDIISCSMNCDKLSVVADSHVINYKIFAISEEIPVSNYGEQFSFIECENRNKNNILFKNSNMFIKNKNKVDIVNLNDEKLLTKTVEVDPNLTILTFLEPSLLLMYDIYNPTKTDVKVYHVPSRREVFTWENVNIGRHRFLNYYRHLEYPSKFVLHFNEDDHLKVLNF